MLLSSRDGFDCGGSGTPFLWYDVSTVAGDTVAYSTLADFVAAMSIEQNAIVVDRDEVFESCVVDPDVSLTLNPSGNAVDAGTYLPNLADFYSGNAPDLRAHESGADPMHYEPRSGTMLHERELHWAKH